MKRLSDFSPNVIEVLARAAVGRSPGECVHLYLDGSIALGTDYESTTPQEPNDIAFTYHPSISADPWDCVIDRQSNPTD